MELKKEKKSILGSRGGMLAVSLLGTLAVAAYPALFLYYQNAAEAHFSEVTAVLLYFLAAAAVLYGIILLITKNAAKTGIIASLFLLVLLNYAGIEKLIQKVFPQLRYWHVLPITVVLLIHIGVLIVKRLPDEYSRYAVAIFGGMFGFLILLNLAIALPTISHRVSAERDAAKNAIQAVNQQGTPNADLPNIYYIICDEYSGFETIKKCYDYDNSAFAEYLTELGFTVSKGSYNDEIATTAVTANLMSLNYDLTYADSTEEERGVARKNSVFFQILREHGYSIRSIADNAASYGLERMDSERAHTSATMGGDSLRDLLLERTPVYPFFGKTLLEEQENILKTFEYLQSAENYGDRGIFTMAHINFPHPPFIFDENGNSVQTENRENFGDKKYYLGQYIYCTKLVEKTVQTIIDREPDSIIILQSDHSARAAEDSKQGRKLFLRMIPYEDAKNILNAVYFGGESVEEINGQSGVNTLRLLLNKMFDDCDYEVLEVPYGSYEKYCEEAELK